MNRSPLRCVTAAFALLLAAGAPLAAVVLTNVDHESSGLSAPGWMAFSPDGDYLYVVNTSGNNGLALFSRDSTPGPTFGALDFVASYSGGNPCNNNILKSATSVVVSPDGLNVYVTSRPTGNLHALTTWSRDTGDGTLACVQQITDKVNLRRGSGLSISPDGATVYLTATSGKQERVSAYSRSLVNGHLTFLQSIKDGTGGANSIAQPTATLVGPGGSQVYATAQGDSAITRFQRNIAGMLSAPAAIVDNAGGADGLAGAAHLAMSSDGFSVYTAAASEDEIGIFGRNGVDGSLTFLAVQASSTGANLDGVSSVAVTGDGGYVFSAAPNTSTLSVFGRNPGNGGLSFVAAITDPGNLNGARFVATSLDSQCVYVAASGASHVEAYCFTARDFGDAPATYATLAADAGARHSLGAAAFLGGGQPDSEADGAPTANASGDDLAGADDENGVVFPGAPILAGQLTSVNLTGTGLADGWVDFNGDGDFDDAGEKVVTGAALPGSPTFTAPPLTVDGTTIVRFRARPTGSATLGAGGGAGDGEVEDHEVAISSESFQVAVSKGGNGSGTVTSIPAGIDCGNACIQPFADGSDVHLDAAPSTGSDFDGWSGASASECAGTSCDFDNLLEDKAVTATFTLQQFELTASVASGDGTIDDVGDNNIFCGSGGADCTETYDYGTQVQLTAVPDSGWVFTGWSGACTNIVGDCVVTITAATSVQATFAEDVYLLTVNPEGGTGTGTVRITNTGNASFIDCRAEVPADPDCTHFYLNGTNLTLTSTADADSFFVDYTGDCTGAACSLTMNQVHSVTATFDLKPDVQAVVPDDRTTRPDDGGVVTIVATVSNVGLVDPSANVTITSAAMTNVNAVTWTCSATGTVCENANGSNVLNESVALPAGSSLTFTFTGTAPNPAFGHVITSVTVTSPDPDLTPANNTDSGFFGYLKIFFDGFETGNTSRWSSVAP